MDDNNQDQTSYSNKMYICTPNGQLTKPIFFNQFLATPLNQTGLYLNK